MEYNYSCSPPLVQVHQQPERTKLRLFIITDDGHLLLFRHLNVDSICLVHYPIDARPDIVGFSESEKKALVKEIQDYIPGYSGVDLDIPCFKSYDDYFYIDVCSAVWVAKPSDRAVLANCEAAVLIPIIQLYGDIVHNDMSRALRNDWCIGGIGPYVLSFCTPILCARAVICRRIVAAIVMAQGKLSRDMCRMIGKILWDDTKFNGTWIV